MKASSIPITSAPTFVFVLADVNGVTRLRRCLPADIPSTGSATAAQATADQAITDAATAQAAADAAQTTANTGVTNATTAQAAATAARVFRLSIACSDETTALTTGTAKVTFRMPCAVTLTAVRASITTVSSSGLVTVDIKEAGVSILSTPITIDVGEKTSTTAAAPPVISDAALADDSEITIDITVAGTGATGLKVALIGNW